MTRFRVVLWSALGMVGVGVSVYRLTPRRQETTVIMESIQDSLIFALAAKLREATTAFPTEAAQDPNRGGEGGPSRLAASHGSPAPAAPAPSRARRAAVTIDPGPLAGAATRRYLCAFPAPEHWFILSDEVSDRQVRAMPLAQQLLLAENLPACTCADRCESACRMSRDASAECRARCPCAP